MRARSFVDIVCDEAATEGRYHRRAYWHNLRVRQQNERRRALAKESLRPPVQDPNLLVQEQEPNQQEQAQELRRQDQAQAQELRRQEEAQELRRQEEELRRQEQAQELRRQELRRQEEELRRKAQEEELRRKEQEQAQQNDQERQAQERQAQARQESQAQARQERQREINEARELRLAKEQALQQALQQKAQRQAEQQAQQNDTKPDEQYLKLQRTKKWEESEIDAVWGMLRRAKQPSPEGYRAGGWTFALKGSIEARRALGFPFPEKSITETDRETTMNRDFMVRIFGDAESNGVLTLQRLKRYLLKRINPLKELHREATTRSSRLPALFMRI